MEKPPITENELPDNIVPIGLGKRKERKVKLPSEPLASVAPIERGKTLRLKKTAIDIHNLEGRERDFYDKLIVAERELRVLLSEELVRPQDKQSSRYIRDLNARLDEVGEMVAKMNAWFKEAEAAKGAIEKKAAMAEVEEINKDVERIIKESREDTE